MQTKEDDFMKQVTKNGLRLTKNRLWIFKILQDSGQPMTIQQIIKSNGDKSHFTSVYRSVESMVASGILRQVQRGFKSYYELGEGLRPHHHHITCEVCQKSQSIENEKVEKLIHELANDKNFKLTGHHFELTGICESCRKAT